MAAATPAPPPALGVAPRQRAMFRDIVDLRARVPASPAGVWTALAADVALRDAAADPDVAIEFGWRGGHHVLARALASPPPSVLDGDDAASAALEALAATLSQALAVSQLRFPLSPAPAASLLALEARMSTATAAAGAGMAHWPELPLPTRLALHVRSSTPSGGPSVAAVECWVRTVPRVVHQLRGQEDVGQLLWPAAILFARWAAANAAVFAGRSIVEVGAGTGLAGVACGLAGAAAEALAGCTTATRVTLTDFNELVLRNLEHNALLNEPAMNVIGDAHGSTLAWQPPIRAVRAGAGGSGTTGWGSPVFKVAPLDFARHTPRNMDAIGAVWQAKRVVGDVGDDTAAFEVAGLPSAIWDGGDAETSTADAAAAVEEGDFDVVIATDVICRPHDAYCLAGLLRRLLRRSGDAGCCERIAFVLVAPPRTRYGVECLPRALTDAGLRFTTRRGDAVMAEVMAHETAMAAELAASGASGPDAGATPAAAIATAIAGGYEALMYEYRVTL